MNGKPLVSVTKNRKNEHTNVNLRYLWGNKVEMPKSENIFDRSFVCAIAEHKRIGNKQIRYGRIYKSWQDVQSNYIEYNIIKHFTIKTWAMKVCNTICDFPQNKS